MKSMSRTLRSDPELNAAIDRARELAEAAGELRGSPLSANPASLPAEAAEIVASWVREGGYSRAAADVAAADPDLADQ